MLAAARTQRCADDQKEAGVFVAVSRLVDQYSDNPAARVAAQEIAGRLGG